MTMTFLAACNRQRARFLAALAAPAQAQADVLHDFLTRFATTAFGKQHGLGALRDAQEFKKAVPIRQYADFEPWLTQEVEAKSGTLGSDPVLRWLKTSGSTATPKRIPLTQYWLLQSRAPALYALWANYFAHHPDLLDTPHGVMDLSTTRDPPKEFLNGVPYQGITNRDTVYDATDWYPPWYDAPWFSPAMPETYHARMYHRIRYFVGEDLRAIVAINPSTIVALKFHIETHAARLVHDIAHGTLDGKVAFTPNPALAQRIAAIVADPGFTLKDIWPSLAVVSSWTSSSAGLYLDKLEALLPGVAVLPFMGCGSEGITTLPVDAHKTSLPLAVNHGYFEFLPAEQELSVLLQDGGYIDTLSFDALEVGREYHLIMSQGNGMFRLALGDIYRVGGFHGQVPRLEFTRREGIYHSFTGEKLTEPQFMQAITEAKEALGIQTGLVMTCPVWGDTPYYKVLVERPTARVSYDAAAFAQVIDARLSSLNEEYKSKRLSGRLGCIETHVVAPNAVDEAIERTRAKGNATQIKYKPFQRDAKLFALIVGHVGHGGQGSPSSAPWAA